MFLEVLQDSLVIVSSINQMQCSLCVASKLPASHIKHRPSLNLQMLVVLPEDSFKVSLFYFC